MSSSSSSSSSSCTTCPFHRYVKIGAAVAVAAFAVYAVSKNCKACCGGKGGEPAAAAAAGAAAAAAAGENSALIFIKPHAQVGGLINDFVVSELRAAKIRIVASGQLPGKVIDEKGCIDDHYASIAAYAMRVAPKDLPVSAEKKAEFAAKFGVGYDAACAAGDVVNVPAAMMRLGLDAAALAAAFEAAKPTTGMKLAPGCYTAKVGGVFVINAFYSPMRAEYCEPRAVVTWFVIAWPEAQLSWADFRAKVLGATDPTKAEASSIRAKILARNTELQLPFVPTMGRNCVHGSASPLEAFNERRIWVAKSGASGAVATPDPFGAALLARGVTATQLDWFCSNPTVEGGKPLFDVVEDMNTSECIEVLVAVAAKQK